MEGAMEDKNEDPLIEEGEVQSSDKEDDDFDIYKGCDLDEPLESNSTVSTDDEWKICLNAEKHESDKKDFAPKTRPKDESSKKSEPKEDESCSSQDSTRAKDRNHKHIPSLLSSKTEPPEYYHNRRNERHYNPRWRNPRNRDYDRGGPYRSRKDFNRYEERQFERRMSRMTESRFKSNK